MLDIPFHPDSLRLFPQRNHRIPSAGFPDTRRLTALKGFIPVVSPILRYYESVERRLRLSGPLFTTKEGAKGTGLGLAVVMGVIEGHGGFVEAESAVGVGSKVRIFLPVLEQGVGAAVKAGGQVAPAPGGTETILFVEDEVRLRNTLCECLEEK